MDKLSLHESLRIYIPGLLFSLIIYCLFKGTIAGIADVAVPAIFIGFAINAPLRKLSGMYFRWLEDTYIICLNADQKTFNKHEVSILSSKFLLLHAKEENPFIVQSTREIAGWPFIAYSYVAKIYDSAETSCFRLPKSFGVMCFNLCIASIAAPLLFFVLLPFVEVQWGDWHWMVIIVAAILAGLFFINATAFLKTSLEKQLYYWASLTKEEMSNLFHLFKVKDNL